MVIGHDQSWAHSACGTHFGASVFGSDEVLAWRQRGCGTTLEANKCAMASGITGNAHMRADSHHALSM